MKSRKTYEMFIKKEIPMKKQQILYQAINGKRNIQRFGKVLPVTLNKEEKALFEQCITQGYAVKQKKENIYNAYSLWCEIHEKPVIYVQNKKKYAKVSCDMVPAKCHLNEKGMEAIEHLFHEKAIYPQSFQGSRHNVTPSLVTCSQIPIEYAEEVALQLVHISHSKEYQKS